MVTGFKEAIDKSLSSSVVLSHPRLTQKHISQLAGLNEASLLCNPSADIAITRMNKKRLS